MYPSKQKGSYKRPEKKFDTPRRSPLPEGFSLFYIAVSCPSEIDEQVNEMKKYMEERYGCQAAKKSPAHLTVIPPFRAEDTTIQALSNFVTTFNIGLVPFDITLKNYGQFGERVLFIDVEKPHQSLLELEQECMQEFSENFPNITFGMKPDFNPHVTIATRDIPEGTLSKARSYFEDTYPFESSFEAKRLTLYKLENGWWRSVE